MLISKLLHLPREKLLNYLYVGSRSISLAKPESRNFVLELLKADLVILDWTQISFIVSLELSFFLLCILNEYILRAQPPVKVIVLLPQWYKLSRHITYYLLGTNKLTFLAPFSFWFKCLNKLKHDTIEVDF